MRNATAGLLIALAAAMAGCASDRTNTSPRDTGLIVDRTPVTTGRKAFDDLLRDLEEHDVAALVSAIEMLPRPCAAGGGHGATPACPPGVSDGTDVRSFGVQLCEDPPANRYLTRTAEVRSVIEYLFDGSQQSSIYAVTNWPLIKHGQPYDVILLNRGDTPSPTAKATMWYVDENARIVFVREECGVPGAAQILEASYGGTSTIGPQSYCEPGAARTRVLVTSLSDVSGGRPQILGTLTDSTSEDDREIITVFNETILPFVGRRAPAPQLPEWRGGPTALADLKPGMVLGIEGDRLRSCVIQSRVIELVDD